MSESPRKNEKTHESYLRQRALWWSRFVVPACIIAVAFIIGLVLVVTTGEPRPNSERYQAVVLDNNQVYFGRLSGVGGKYLRLENAFYAKNQQLPAEATQEQIDAVANNVALTKVGSEVYGPESTMMIRAEKVLFWQDLKENSKVVSAIQSQQ